MQFDTMRLADVVLITPRVFSDARGYFLETWRAREFAEAGIEARFVQDNHSRSVRHTLRGLHYQVVQPQGKLVRVVRGAVFDVAVDLRLHSPTFGRWMGVELTADNYQMLWIPRGFAHGYLALSDEVDVLYRCTDEYAPEHERVIRWDDPTLRIDWPLPANVAPLLSPRDRAGAMFKDGEHFP